MSNTNSFLNFLPLHPSYLNNNNNLTQNSLNSNLYEYILNQNLLKLSNATYINKGNTQFNSQNKINQNLPMEEKKLIPDDLNFYQNYQTDSLKNLNYSDNLKFLTNNFSINAQTINQNNLALNLLNGNDCNYSFCNPNLLNNYQNLNMNTSTVNPYNGFNINIYQNNLSNLQNLNLLYNINNLCNNYNINRVSNIYKNAEEIFICKSEGCGKKFELNEILNHHSITCKSVVKSFRCTSTNCGKSYKSRENLNLHIKNKHLGVKPYTCNFCASKFSHRNGKLLKKKKILFLNYF